MFKIKDRVKLINGTIATIVGIENEPISLNKVYLIDKEYKYSCIYIENYCKLTIRSRIYTQYLYVNFIKIQ